MSKNELIRKVDALLSEGLHPNHIGNIYMTKFREGTVTLEELELVGHRVGLELTDAFYNGCRLIKKTDLYFDTLDSDEIALSVLEDDGIYPDLKMKVVFLQFAFGIIDRLQFIDRCKRIGIDATDDLISRISGNAYMNLYNPKALAYGGHVYVNDFFEDGDGKRIPLGLNGACGYLKYLTNKIGEMNNLETISLEVAIAKYQSDFPHNLKILIGFLAVLAGKEIDLKKLENN